MNKNNEILSCTISEIWQTTGPIFSVDRGECPCLTHLFEVNPKFRVVKFCLDQEARNILYRMVWSVFRYHKPFRRGSQVWQKTDTRTDRLCDSKCRASLRCAAEKKQRNVPACHAGTCYTCPLLSGKSFIDHVNNSRKQHCACSSMTIGTLAAEVQFHCRWTASLEQPQIPLHVCDSDRITPVAEDTPVYWELQSLVTLAFRALCKFTYLLTITGKEGYGCLPVLNATTHLSATQAYQL